MLSWRKTTTLVAPPPAGEGDAAIEQSSPGLARALERVLELDQPARVLDLGSLCGKTAVYLAGRGARVWVEEFDPQPAPEAESEDAEPVAPPVLSLQHVDDAFDLILAWDLVDYVSPEQVGPFVGELQRLLAPKGWLMLLAQDNPSKDGAWQERPWRYRVTADDRLVRSPATRPERDRWFHGNRAIQSALEPLSIQQVHLQRNRIREFLAQRTKG